MTFNRIALVVGTIAATACRGPADTSTSSTDAKAAVQNYQATGQDLTAAVAQYGSATATMPDLAACRAAQAAYEARVGPALDRMNAASHMMDQYMYDSTGPTAADMACVAAAMSLEYQRHMGVACGASTVSANQAEAAQHAAAMYDWADHQRVRYEQVGAATGVMPTTTDTTWHCHQNADGTFTMGGYTWTPTQTPPAPGTGTNPTPTPAPWPMPCGGYGCRCG